MDSALKRKIINLTAFLLALVLFFAGLSVAIITSASSLIRSSDGFVYPDYPLANAEDDSWNQWQSYDDEVIEVEWFIDDTSSTVPGNDSVVVQEILKKTGIKINFKKATSSDGSEISMKISGNNLPDIISIKANTTLKSQLAEDEACYPIQELAKRWAPSFLKRLEEDAEMVNYYTYSDGNLYGIPNNFYMTQDVEDYENMGYSLLPTGAVLTRKDYLDAYHAYKTESDPSFDPASVATPDGIFEYLMWVKQTYNLSNSNPTVNISAFEKDRTHGSLGMRWLMEYFSVPEEDGEGNYVYQQAQPEFEELMVWLNKLYRNNLLPQSSLAANSSSVGQYLQNGNVVLFAGSTVSYATQLKNWELNVDNQNPLGTEARYVPIIFSNAEGTVPQLAVTGNSYLYTMISTNCKRPDRVIKLFDYLYSEEGQRLVCYGLEQTQDNPDGSFVYTVRPGTTKTLDDGTQYTYRYGQIEYSDVAKQAWNENKVDYYAFYQLVFFYKPMYMYLSSSTQGQFNNYRDYVKYNSKAALIPYAYSYRGFEFELDSSDSRYTEMYTQESKYRDQWYKMYARIIGANSEESVKTLISNMIDWCKNEKLDEYIAFKNECFQKHKQSLGIRFASPINEKSEEYLALRVDSVYGDSSRYISVPESIPRK